MNNMFNCTQYTHKTVKNQSRGHNDVHLHIRMYILHVTDHIIVLAVLQCTVYYPCTTTCSTIQMKTVYVPCV